MENEKKTRFNGMNIQNAVIMMVEALSTEGAIGGGVPFLLKIKPDVARPIGFASRDLAERLMPRFKFGRKVWLESATFVIHNFPTFFSSGEMIFFNDMKTMDKFVNEGDYLPLIPLSEIGESGSEIILQIPLPIRPR